MFYVRRNPCVAIRAVVLLVPALLLHASSLHACAMFTLVEGDTVLLANNEDYIKPGYVWFTRATDGRFGRINFGFKDQFTQGGMNEKGLGFDAAVVPEVPWTPDPAKKDTKNLLDHILDTCATVDEAIACFETWNCKHLATTQFMLADATGASAVVTWLPDAGLSVVRRTGDYQLITNTRIAASGFRCERHVLASRILDGGGGDPFARAAHALDAMHQRGKHAYTSYSNIYDLKAREVHVFNLANFEERVTFNLAEELAKGKQRHALEDLFRQSPKLRERTGAEPRTYDTRIPLPDTELARFAGRYSVMNGTATVEITAAGDQLLIDAAKGNPAHLYPESETTFRIVEGGQMTFKRGPDGEITGFTLHRNGDHEGRRLPEE